jgi:hypothetical protein
VKWICDADAIQAAIAVKRKELFPTRIGTDEAAAVVKPAVAASSAPPPSDLVTLSVKHHLRATLAWVLSASANYAVAGRLK